MSTPIILSWCPGKDPPNKCDPCACHIVPTTRYEQNRLLQSYNINFGTTPPALCSPYLAWPFYNQTAITTGGSTNLNYNNYSPLGLGDNQGSFNTPPSKPGTQTHSLTATIIYLGVQIALFRVTRTLVTTFDGFIINYVETWASVPRSNTPFEISEKTAHQLMAQAGASTIAQIFGNNVTTDPETGNVQLTGWVYTGPLDLTQEIIFQVTTDPGGFFGPVWGSLVLQTFYGGQSSQ